MSDLKDNLRQAAAAIRDCDGLWIGAGAGMGVDSGLPDFRGDEGFWNAYPPYRNLGLSFYDLANPKWFRQKPEQAWGFYGHRLKLYRDTVPHSGFAILKRWSESKSENSYVFTSNVDGQFQRAGFGKNQVVECHGSIHFLQCSQNCHEGIWSAKEYSPEIDLESMLAQSPMPECVKCKAIARPNILMFGDWNWNGRRTDHQTAQYENWLRTAEPNDVAIEFGAGTAIPTVRYELQRFPGKLIRVNPREPQITGGLSFEMDALEFLQRIDELI